MVIEKWDLCQIDAVSFSEDDFLKNKLKKEKDFSKQLEKIDIDEETVSDIHIRSMI